MSRKIILCLILLLMMSTYDGSAHASGKNVNFVILRPDKDHPFWDLFEQAMKDACNDIGCNVDVKYADWDRFKMIDQAKALAFQKPKPDAVFFQSMKENGVEIIKTLDELKINAFLINAGLTRKQYQEIGKPREKYKYWLGQMMPDDYNAGAMNAEALYKYAKENGYVNDGKVYMAAIEGNSSDGASIERVKGLRSVVDKHNDIELLQIASGKWDTATSKKVATTFFMRYPDLRIIWAVGDPTAFGVVDAGVELNKVFATSGVDWAPRALDEIEKGRMLGSVGGHFMEGAWAAIAVHDYLHGIDFADNEGVEMNSNMAFLNKDNIAEYKRKFGDGHFDAIDFKTISKFYNKQIKKYNFDITSFISVK